MSGVRADRAHRSDRIGGGRDKEGDESPHRTEAAAGVRRLLLNGASLLGAYLLPRAFTFASAVVAARWLGVEAFGAYGTAAALAVLLSIAATLGMMQLLVREIARQPERGAELVGAANLVKAVSGAVMMVLLVVLLEGLFQDAPQVVACGLLLGVGYAVGSWVENLGAYFQAVERMHVWMQAQTLFGLVSGSAAIAAVLATGSVVWFAGAPAIGQLAALAWLLARAPAPVRSAWRAPWPLVARLLRSLVPFAASVLALTAYAKLDVLLLERWRGLGEAGVYAAAYKFVDLTQALALVVAAALYPRISRTAEPGGAGIAPASGAGGKSAPRDPAAARTTELVLLVGVPAASLLWLLREPVVSLLFGRAYADAAGVLFFLAPVLPLLALNVLATFVLAASGRMSVVAALYAGGVVLDLTLNAALIPSRGAEGAAIARLCSEAVLGVAMLVALRRLAGSAPSVRVALAAAVVALPAALPAWSALPPPGAAAAYLGIAAGVYLLVGVVSARELAILRRAVGR